MLKKVISTIFLSTLFAILWHTQAAFADTAELEQAIANAQISADTAFMLICSALVLLMTPGLAFFYGGFVSKRNVLNTLMMSFVLMGIAGVTWILWGYSLTFAPGNPFIGGLQWIFGNVGLETTGYLAHLPYEDALLQADPNYADMTSYSGTIPHQTFMIYQCMFAIVTPALISGAIVERISFKAYVLFVTFWSLFIYAPVVHMMWGKGGFLGITGGLGALDFAGGIAIHIISGVSALVAVMVIGPRKIYPDNISPPHNVPFILLGTGLLWFGWFGFNAGSALASGNIATVAFVSTNTGAASGMVMWLLLEYFLRGKATAVGTATGAIAGLAGITPAVGFVTPLSAILIGAICAFFCFFAISFKVKLGIDDSLDTYPVHGVGGTIGAILTGVFATSEVNPVAKGLIDGNPKQVLIQLIAIIIAYLIAGVGTFVLLKIIDATVGLRLKPEPEMQGMDINEHGEEGYGEEFTGGLSQTSFMKISESND